MPSATLSRLSRCHFSGFLKSRLYAINLTPRVTRVTRVTRTTLQRIHPILHMGAYLETLAWIRELILCAS